MSDQRAPEYVIVHSSRYSYKVHDVRPDSDLAEIRCRADSLRNLARASGRRNDTYEVYELVKPGDREAAYRAGREDAAPGRPVMSAEDPRPFAELRDSGLFWLINRVVFHPRGFALALVVDTATGEATGWKLQGDGSEVWCFNGDEDGLYAAAKATLELAALRNRPPSQQLEAGQPLPEWERDLLERQDIERRIR